ncbi:MAG: DUF4230 domain-containing protein [Clostridia bacterium]|nr:DUF4230 domain-containing protein [Clostridia bacterium]
MAEKTEIKANASLKDDAKIKAQQDDLAAAKAQKAAADKKAEEAKIEAAKKAEEAKKAKEEAAKKAAEDAKKAKIRTDVESQTASAAVALAGAALGGKKSKGFFAGLVIGLILGALVMNIFSGMMATPVQVAKDEADKIIEEKLTGYTAVDFKNAVLGEAKQHQELIVLEQPLEIATTISKSGFANLAVFSKTKNITFAGSGVYTVDLKNLDSKHIDVDEEGKVVYITVPHAALQYVILDPDKMEFEDTEKGLLSFGDLALTTEQQNELEKAAKAAMNERLQEADLFKKADEFAEMKCWATFQPLVSAVSPEYKVEIKF